MPQLSGAVHVELVRVDCHADELLVLAAVLEHEVAVREVARARLAAGLIACRLSSKTFRSISAYAPPPTDDAVPVAAVLLVVMDEVVVDPHRARVRDRTGLAPFGFGSQPGRQRKPVAALSNSPTFTAGSAPAVNLVVVDLDVVQRADHRRRARGAPVLVRDAHVGPSMRNPDEADAVALRNQEVVRRARAELERDPLSRCHRSRLRAAHVEPRAGFARGSGHPTRARLPR